jgi:hypothetical protein
MGKEKCDGNTTEEEGIRKGLKKTMEEQKEKEEERHGKGGGGSYSDADQEDYDDHERFYV